MSGETTPTQNAAFLAALSTKNTRTETIDEISGCAAAMRELATPVEHPGIDTLEIVGTGGDRSNTFNISTTAALLCAAAGAKVTKHGDRAASSKSGTADCLEALGVNIQQDPQKVVDELNTCGIASLFAQKYHSAMRYVGAIRKELGFRTVFAMVRRVRRHCDVPLLFTTYANVVFSYGIERFAKTEADCGMDGLILPDVPFEEKEEFDVPFAAEGLDLVSLIAPTSHERIRTIAKAAHGFVYVVSSLGVTGVQSNITTDVGAMVEMVRQANPDVPAAVGFGISTPGQAERMERVSDGAIVGSAIVRMIAKDGKDAVEPVADYVRSMKQAVMRAGVVS